MEKLNPYSEISEPDLRNTLWVKSDGTKLTLQEYYQMVERIELRTSVPEEIHSQWNVTRNVWLYSWHVYSFHQVAEMKAFSVLELALKTKLGKPKWMLHRCLKEAVQQGYFNKDDFVFSNGLNNPMSNEEYVNGLLHHLPNMRNRHAHEGTILHPDSMLHLGLCADLINQLFKPEYEAEE